MGTEFLRHSNVLRETSWLEILFSDIPEALENNHNFPLDVTLDLYFQNLFYQTLVLKKMEMPTNC